MRDYKGRFFAGFKVGDRVILLDGGSAHTHAIPNLEDGQEYVIESIDTDGMFQIQGPGSWVYSHELKPAEPKPAPSPKFSAGDTVTIKGQAGEWTVDAVEPCRYLCSQHGIVKSRMHWAKPEDMKKVPLTAKQRAKRETEIALDVIKQNPAFAGKPEVSQDPVKIEVVVPDTQIGDVSLGSPVDGDIVITSKGGKVVNGYSFTDGSTASCADTLRIKALDYGTTAKPAIVPGSVVRLRSGGPDMTVSLVEGDIAGVVWFTDEIDGYRRVPLVCLEFVR